MGGFLLWFSVGDVVGGSFAYCRLRANYPTRHVGQVRDSRIAWLGLYLAVFNNHSAYLSHNLLHVLYDGMMSCIVGDVPYSGIFPREK
jgi:hypothetical protein